MEGLFGLPTGRGGPPLYLPAPIPGLAASPHRAGVGPTYLVDRAGMISPYFVEEFDTTVHGLVQSGGTVAVLDSNQTVQSHVYCKITATSTIHLLRPYSPGQLFEAMAHLAIGCFGDTATVDAAGFVVCDSTNNKGLLFQMEKTSSTNPFQVVAYTYSGGAYTGRGTAFTYRTCSRYFKFARDGSDNVSFYDSELGIPGSWRRISTVNFTSFTPAQIGYRIYCSGNNTVEFISDYMRAT